MPQTLQKCYSLEELVSAFSEANSRCDEYLMQQFLSESSQVCRDLYSGQQTLTELQCEALHELVQLRADMENCLKDLNRGLSFSDDEFKNLSQSFMVIIPRFKRLKANL